VDTIRTISVNTQVDEKIASDLAYIEKATGRKKNALFHEALVNYVRREMKFLEAVEAGIKDAEEGRVCDFDVAIEELRKDLRLK